MTHVVLFNYGDKPARVERVRLVNVTGPLKLLGVRTRQIPSPDGYPLGALGFPPTEYTSKSLVQDNVVPVPETFTEAGEPNEHLQLVIGVTTTGPGVATAWAVEVTYKVGGRRYREILENPMHLCSPFSEYEAEGCPPKRLKRTDSDLTLG